jgi:DNA-binding MarR family transcriptional regulator
MWPDDGYVDRIESSQLLHLIYPLHCRIAAAFEDSIRGELTPVQGCILWMFRPHIPADHRHIPVDEGPSLPRKEIARWVKRWFGITSAAISHAIHGMSSPPLVLVRLVTDSSSGREKRVCLTRTGEQFLATMEKRGRLWLELVEGELSDEQLREGLELLRAFVLAVGKVDARAEADRDTSRRSIRSVGCSSN